MTCEPCADCEEDAAMVEMDIQTLTAMLMGYKRPSYLYENERIQVDYHLIPYLERLSPSKSPTSPTTSDPSERQTGRLHQPSCFFLCTGFGAGEADRNSPPRRSFSALGRPLAMAADLSERAEGIIAPAGITADTVDPLLPQQLQNRLLIGTVPDAAGIGQEHPLSGTGFQRRSSSGIRGAVFRNNPDAIPIRS